MFIYLFDHEATKEMMARVGQSSPLKPVRPGKRWFKPALPQVRLRFQMPRIEILTWKGDYNARPNVVA